MSSQGHVLKFAEIVEDLLVGSVAEIELKGSLILEP